MTITVGWLDGESNNLSGAALRQLASGLLIPGASPLAFPAGVKYTDGSDLRVSKSPTGFSLRFAPGMGVTSGNSPFGTGSFPFSSSVNEDRALTPASLSASRIDVAGFEVVDNGGGSWTHDLVIVTGTAGSGTRPTLPANFCELAQIGVPANAAIADVTITDTRAWIQPYQPPKPAWTAFTPTLNVWIMPGTTTGKYRVIAKRLYFDIVSNVSTAPTSWPTGDDFYFTGLPVAPADPPASVSQGYLSWGNKPMLVAQDGTTVWCRLLDKTGSFPPAGSYVRVSGSYEV